MSGLIQPAIMAGGSGTRLWPLSRAGYPKQFLGCSAMRACRSRRRCWGSLGSTTTVPRE
jgi:mannose-1-phosphate guanylyltransferase